MNVDFKHMKSQIKPDRAVVNDTIQKANEIRHKKSNLSFKRVSALAATVCMILICVIAVPIVKNLSGTMVDPYGTDGGGNQDRPQIEGAQSYNEGVTISEYLCNLMESADPDTVFSVKMKVLNLTDAYEQDYADLMYDGKTYDQWWAEYETYTSRMIEIDALLKDGADEKLETEYNLCVDQAEEVLAYMSQIRKEQKAVSLEKEQTWLASMGIEAEYKAGYFIFSATADQIKNIKGGMCDYLIDAVENPQETPEEPH